MQYSSADGIKPRLYSAYGTAPSEASRRVPYLRNMVKLHFPPDLTINILDLGCGNGDLLALLQEIGYKHLQGVDISPSQLGNTSPSVASLIHNKDLLAHVHTCPSDSYSLIITFDVIEHLSRPELLLLADEVYRILKPNGRWIIHAPNSEGIFGARIRYSDLTHELAFTTTSLMQLTRIAGFPAFRAFEDTPIRHGIVSSIRSILWFAIRSFVAAIQIVETGAAPVALSQNILAVAIK
jgi:SAM-dependent methyltransferase